MPSKAFKLAEAMVSNPVMSDMVENPTATPTQIAAVETKTSAISDTGVISVNTKNIVSNNTLTQSFDSNQIIEFNLTDSINSVSPLVSVFKEIPVTGVSSKGQWNVNANATNYNFFDEKPISYASATLTPSATGDGTFTNSSAIVTPYKLSNLSYDSKSYNATGEFAFAEGIAFKSDGTKMYLTGFNTASDQNTNQQIRQYSLSTAYDISTATYDNIYLNTSGQNTRQRDLRFKPDGTVLYMVGSTPDGIWQYNLSTAWDLSTASYANKTINVGTQDTNPSALALSPDGTKVYIGGYSSKTLYQYNLSTAWDLSTASYSNNSFATTNDFNYSHSSLELNSDASRLFIGRDGYEIAEFSLPIDGNVSNISYIATYDVRNTTVGNKNIGGMAFANNGAKFYIFGNNDMGAYQFSSTASLAFNAADVGKKVVGNSGSAIITGTSGTYKSVTAFADTSAISSWQLFGAQGKSDGSGIELSGFSSSYGTIYGKSLSDVVNHTTDAFNSINFFIDFVISPDGTKLFYTQYNDGKIYERAISTAWDLSTISLTDTISGGHLLSNAPATYISGFTWSTDGMKLYVVYANSSTVAEFYNDPNYPQFAFRVDTLTYSGSNKTLNTNLSANTGIIFKNDGTMVFISNGSTPSVYSWPLSTAWNLSTAGTRVQSNINFSSNYLQCLAMSADGTSMIVGNESNDNLQHFTLSTPFDITTMTETSQTHHINTVITGSMNSGADNPNSIQWADNGNRFFVYTNSNGASLTSTNQKAIYQFSTGSETHPYSQYSPALTNSSNGQINSSSWLDINSMTADETKNDGDVFYAVSTDNRTSWRVAKASDGVRKIARNNSGTWQYNNNTGISTSFEFSLSSPSYESEFRLDDGTNGWSNGWPAVSAAFNNDGTKMYAVMNAYNSGQNPTVYEYNLSVAYDVSTASYNTWINVQPQTGNRGLAGHPALQFSPNGTYMYVTSTQLSVYTLSTPWDISTATHTRNISKSGFGTYDGLYVTSNGIICKSGSNLLFATINDYSLSTVGSVQTISGAFGSISVETLVANSDASKVFIHTGNVNSVEGWIEYDRSSSSTLSTSDTFTQINVWYHGLSYDPKAGQFNIDGSKMIIGADVTGGKGVRVFSTTGSALSYGTSETWVNGTNNNEHATLQQALTSQAFNRMNKAQLDAIADGYHFSQDSADTLDLMIAPYAPSGTSPISDGVTINYDAEALVREAIPGTDYIAEFPNSSTINIKSLVNANIKVRAL